MDSSNTRIVWKSLFSFKWVNSKGIDGRGNEREGQGRKKNRDEREETEEIKTFPPLPLPVARIASLAQL